MSMFINGPGANGRANGAREPGASARPVDILLFSPPPWLVTGPPLGLAALSAWLRGRGWNVAVIDGNTRAYHKTDTSLRPLWLWDNSAFWEDPEPVEVKFGPLLRELADEVATHRPRVLGINVVSRKEAASAIFLARLKERLPDLKVFVGGPGAGWRESRDHIRQLCGDLVDGFIVGEGELACDELLRRLRDGAPLANLPGFVSGRPDGEECVIPGHFITDMNQLPIPDFSDFRLADYEEQGLVVEWNRGCVARCTYCSINDYWNAFRFKAPEKVADELRTLHERHGISRFTIVDPMVNGDPELLDAICDAIVATGIHVKWSAGISPNRIVGKSTFEKMKAAGCFKLEFGVDSGSRTMLRKMGKRFKPDEAGQMMRDCKDAGIQVMLYLIVGFPGETDETVQETCDWLDRWGGAVDMIRNLCSLTIEYGTAIEKRADLFGVEFDRHDVQWKDNWQGKGDDTPLRRAMRVRKVIDKVHDLGIPIETEVITDPEHATHDEHGQWAGGEGASDAQKVAQPRSSIMCASFPTGSQS
ncbi:B12-binding domain-containing radical SAM protein [bacterium]|nr:B12-binding domain-containing radical SAM protein [bacterium]